MRSASLFIKTPRCEALIFRHGPLSKAARAAATAVSAAGASDSAAWVITSPVDGLIVGKVFPDTLSTHFPLISSFVGPILTFDSITAVAVAIVSSSCAFAQLPGGRRARPLGPRVTQTSCKGVAYTPRFAEARWSIAGPKLASYGGY